MQDLLKYNQFTFVSGGFASIQDDNVFNNPVSDDVSQSVRWKDKWTLLAPVFPYYRLYLITDGYAEFQLANSDALRLEKNKMYLIPPYSVRSVNKNVNIEHYFFHFKSESQIIDPLKYYNITSPVDTDEHERELFRMLLQNYKKKNLRSAMTTQGCFLMLMSKFFAPDTTFDPEINRFAPVLDYIEKNIGNKITVKALADILGYSEAYFCSIFSRHFRQSPMRFISERKVLLAQQYLTLANISIREVSDKLGFDNEFYFNAFFKKNVGTSPGKWRKIYFEQNTIPTHSQTTVYSPDNNVSTSSDTHPSE